MNSKKFVIISPCRNEELYMRTTLDSVISQTNKPSLWVIVDDGSTDDTPNILAEYAQKHIFIKIISRKNRGHRSVGPGVIDAFYSGYDLIKGDDFDYICKLDLDLDLPPKYFETLIRRMEKNPRIGTSSGKPYFINSKDKLVSERCGDENSVGMTKLYKRRCFDQIGGFVREVMWDGIDGHRCRMLGWLAESLDDPGLRFIHLRPMGSSQKNWITGRMRHGFGQYYMGTGLIYMTVSSLYRMSSPPLVIGGFAMWLGYINSVIKQKHRLNDPNFRNYLRKYQWACLIFGKKKATKYFNQIGASIWDPNAKKKSFPPNNTISTS